MGTLDDINRKRRGYITYSTQSKDQAPVPGKKFNMIGVPGATVPPRLGVEQGLNEQEVEAEKNGPNGEVVTLADQKPQQDVTIPQREHRTTNGGAMPTRNADGERTQPVNTPAAPQQANTPKPRVPGADIAQPSVYGIRKQSRDLAARVMGWDDIMRVVNQSYPRKTAEDIEKEQRKEKRDALLATIGDGLGAFHEAYSHMRGVQPMTSGTSVT